MTLDVAIAPVRKSLLVPAPQARAFEIFTAGIDRWWPKSHGIGEGAVLRSVIEPFQGGRWYAEYAGGQTVTNGHVLAWEPPHRVMFSWEISGAWKANPGLATASEIEVTFTPEGPDTTRLELEHRNFAVVPGGAKMRADVDGGWPSLLELYRGLAEQERK